MRADGRTLKVHRLDQRANVRRVTVQAQRLGKAVLRAQHSAVVIVRQVGVIEAHLANGLELPPHRRDRLD